MISTNLHRRHLTDSQRAMVAAKIAERSRGSNRYQAKVEASSEASTQLQAPPTQDEAAQMLNVSRSQVQRARIVEKSGTEGLKAVVESGAVPVATAARVANELTPAEQDEFHGRELVTDRTAKPQVSQRGTSANLPEQERAHP